MKVVRVKNLLPIRRYERKCQSHPSTCMKVGYQGKSQPAMTQALPDTLVYAQHQSYMVQISLDYLPPTSNWRAFPVPVGCSLVDKMNWSWWIQLELLNLVKNAKQIHPELLVFRSLCSPTDSKQAFNKQLQPLNQGNFAASHVYHKTNK